VSLPPDAEIITAETAVGTSVGSFWPGGSGRPIVLIHGLTAERESWGPLVPELVRKHPVLAVDLRGHGDSSWATWTPGSYRAESMAADVGALCEAVDLADAFVVGHSLGARVAMHLALVPGLVSSLALSDTFPVVGEAGALWALNQIGERFDLAGVRDLDAATQWLRDRHPEWTSGWAPSLAASHFRENWAGRLVFRCDPHLKHLLVGRESREEAQRNREVSSAVGQPIALLWGRDSPLVSESDVRDSLELLPGAQVLEFQTGHYIMREQEEEWLEAVLALAS
jgi:pimeloyl-ACP methyl ester carboxylesterase